MNRPGPYRVGGSGLRAQGSGTAGEESGLRPQTRSPRPPLRWLAVLGWAGVIWLLSTLPPEKTPQIGLISVEDKLGHAAVYCVWGLLICWAVQKTFHAISRAGTIVVSILAVAAYAAATELYQAGIGRNAEFSDFLSDVAGAIVACYLYFSPRIRAVAKKVAGAIRGPSAASSAKPGPEGGERSLGESKQDR